MAVYSILRKRVDTVLLHGFSGLGFTDANVYIDGVFQREVNNNQNYPIEGYQMTVFRADGLSPGAHTITLEIVSNSGYVVVDAFDVR